MAKTFQFRLTGMVKAKVLRFDEDLSEFVETGEERYCYMDDIANMRGRVMEKNERYVVIDRECREKLDGCPMKMQRESGLVAPKSKRPEPPAGAYGPLELVADEDRERAKKALVELWHVLGLYDNQGLLQSGDKAVRAARLYAWQHLSAVLLGDEMPDCEQLT